MGGAFHDGSRPMSRIGTAAAAPGAPARTLALTLALGAMGLALWLPPLTEGLPLAGQRALVVTIVTIVLWTTEALEPGVSTSALVICERGHVCAGEVLRFGLWMTLLAWVAIVLVALPWWATVGEPLRPR